MPDGPDHPVDTLVTGTVPDNRSGQVMDGPRPITEVSISLQDVAMKSTLPRVGKSYMPVGTAVMETTSR